MRITYYIPVVIIAASIIAGCVRKNDVIVPEPLPKGGETGMCVLRVTPQHHKVNLSSAMVYIKYGATSMPARDQFDDSAPAVFDQNRPIAYLDTLGQGDYYIYAEGRDNTLEAGLDSVYGGGHFRIIDSFNQTYDLYLQTDNPMHHK